ncbi:MAG TPA: glycosyltransferase family 4 protein [Ktedonobacteraceae bacterium]|nr:glycosyltransferase family 4 protein [Ktedonobacteraceae bacterium]
MRIAHIAPPWFPIPPKNYGGTENVIFQLVEEQVAQGHSVTLFAPEDAKTSAQQVSFLPRALRECDIPWQSHPKAFYHSYKSIEHLQKHSREFDILHTHLSSLTDLYTFPLTSTLPIPHVATLHSQFPFDRDDPTETNADDYYMEWISQVPMVTISHHAKREEMRKARLRVIDVIYHGINLNNFPTPQNTAENFFVWLGRLVPEKGAHLAIEAAQKAGVPLVIAGIVDEYVPEAEEYFENEIKPHLSERLISFIGPVDFEQRNALFRKARGMLNPLQWEEPFGMVMIEAMATGCPVIAFPRGAAEEIITSEKVGCLANDVAEMVKCIRKIDDINRQDVRAYIEKHFSAKVMVENYIRVYQKVIAQQQSSYLLPLKMDIPTNGSKKISSPLLP